jgi:hypothetical protein
MTLVRTYAVVGSFVFRSMDLHLQHELGKLRRDSDKSCCRQKMNKRGTPRPTLDVTRVTRPTDRNDERYVLEIRRTIQLDADRSYRL